VPTTPYSPGGGTSAHSVLTFHNKPVPTTPYSPAGGTTAHSVLTSRNKPVPTTPYSPGGGISALSVLTFHSTLTRQVVCILGASPLAAGLFTTATMSSGACGGPKGVNTAADGELVLQAFTSLMATGTSPSPPLPLRLILCRSLRLSHGVSLTASLTVSPTASAPLPRSLPHQSLSRCATRWTHRHVRERYRVRQRRRDDGPGAAAGVHVVAAARKEPGRPRHRRARLLGCHHGALNAKLIYKSIADTHRPIN
jgi:hypothetical protein